MPIIKPEIQKVLRTAGLVEESNPQGSVDESLINAGLDNESLAEELTGLALRSNNENLRLRAIETALKVKGALKETAPQVPSFTIVIQNSPASVSPDLNSTQGVNPILFPRQSLNSREGKEN